VPDEYSFEEVRGPAEEMYVLRGMTQEQVAAELGVAVTTIQRWCATDGWKEARKEYEDSIRQSRLDLLRLRASMLKKALASLDAQDVFAAIRVQSTALATERAAEKGQTVTAPDLPRLFMEFIEFVAGVLKDADPEGLKVLARNFDLLVERFKAAHAA
jgi:transcriptional regulator with XRE-family HTH domain